MSYLQVNADEVYCSTAFVPVGQVPNSMSITPGVVGFLRDLTIYDLTDRRLADSEIEHLLNENQNLREEVADLEEQVQGNFEHLKNFIEGD
jgi:hypothetical protein